MMIERIEPQKIYIYAVVPYTEWQEYVPTEEYESEFDYWADGDYQVFAIVVDDQLIFLDDNMHNHPNDFLEGVCCALEKFFNISLIHDVLYLDEDVYAYDKTKVQEAIYEKWESGN